MLPVSIQPVLEHVPVFLMVLFRMIGLFVFAPMFGSQIIPVKIKGLLALGLSVGIYPLLPVQVPVELSLMTMGLAVGSEMLIGLLIGYGASLPIIAMQTSGLLMGQQLGVGLAEVFNNDTDSETNVLGQGFFLMALVVFLGLGGERAMLDVMVGSFGRVPLGGYAPDASMMLVVTGLLTSMFDLALRVAAPLLCLVFLETVAMGFLARTVPQLNVLSLGFPLRILIGLALLTVMLTHAAAPLSRFLQEAIMAVSDLLLVK